MPGNSILLNRIDRDEVSDLSILYFQILPSFKTSPGISWIYLNFSSGTIGLGTLVDSSIPFMFYDGDDPSLRFERGRSRALLQANTFNAIISIWPSYGKQNKDTLVTVRLKGRQIFMAGWNEVPKMEELQIISLCTGGGDAAGLCGIESDWSMCAQRVECNQQIPLSSITSSQDNVITLQYRTIISTRTGSFVHMLSFRGSRNISLAPSWNFEYSTPDFATIDLVVPSHAPNQGGSIVQIFLSQLRVGSIHGVVPAIFVKFGSADAIITNVTPWDSINGTVISVQIPPSETASPGITNLSVIVSNSQTYSTFFEYLPTESLKVLSITPSRGPADGNTPNVLLIENKFILTQGPRVYRVAVDGVLCLANTLQMDQSSVSADLNLEYVSFQVPPHAPGMAVVVISVGNTVQNFTSSATVQFWFESELRAFGAINTWSPDDGLAVAYTLLAVKLRYCPSASLLDYFVVLEGNGCELLRLDMLSSSECALFLSAPTFTQIGLAIATIEAQDYFGNMYSTETVFAISRGTTIKQVYPSTGPTSGMTVLQILFTDFPTNSSLKDVTVLFAGVKGTLSDMAMAGFVSQIAVVSPPCPVAEGGLVKVEIFCPTCSEDIYLTFEYLYTVPHSKILSISASSIPFKAGIPLIVHVQNFPLLQGVDHVQVTWGGQVSNSPKNVITSNEVKCVLLLDTPEQWINELQRKGGDILVLITPVMDGSMSVTFSLHIEASEPRVLLVTPSMGPSRGGFPVDVLIQNFPAYPPGSFDESYLDISGPMPPFIEFQGSMILKVNSIRAIQKSVDSWMTQISFNVSLDLFRDAGEFKVNIGTRNDQKVLVTTSLFMYHPEKAVILSVSRSMGFSGVSGTLVTVVAGSLLLNSLEISKLIVTAATVPCEVKAIVSSGFQSQITFKISSVLPPGLVKINMSDSSDSSRSASFQFLVLPSCRAGSNLLQYGDYFRPSADNWFSLQSFGLSLCINERIPFLSPQVSMLMPSFGSTNGGTVIQLYCTGFFGFDLRSQIEYELELSDIIVMIGGSLSRVQSFRLDNSVMWITAEIPRSTKLGSVLGSVHILKQTNSAARFLFFYYNQPKSPPLILSVLPTSGLLGTTASVAVQVCALCNVECTYASDKVCYLYRLITGFLFKIMSVYLFLTSTTRTMYRTNQSCGHLIISQSWCSNQQRCRLGHPFFQFLEVLSRLRQ